METCLEEENHMIKRLKEGIEKIGEDSENVPEAGTLSGHMDTLPVKVVEKQNTTLKA